MKMKCTRNSSFDLPEMQYPCKFTVGNVYEVLEHSTYAGSLYIKILNDDNDARWIVNGGIYLDFEEV